MDEELKAVHQSVETVLGEKIEALKKELIEYAGLVETMVERSVKGLLQREKEMLLEVMEKYEPRANDTELAIDELCVRLIAQYQPTAVDLRTILMVYRINNDLERLADHAVNIVQSSLFLVEQPLVKPLIDIPKMAEIVVGMLKDAINSFVVKDVSLAKDLCERDAEVNGLRRQIIRELITYMISDTTTIERSLHLIRVSNNLERVADLATNISEDVIFMVQGRVIKHHKDESHQ